MVDLERMGAPDMRDGTEHCGNCWFLRIVATSDHGRILACGCEHLATSACDLFEVRADMQACAYWEER